MSKGSKVVPLRISQELLDEIARSVESANYHTKGELYTTSSWIRKCIQEKLDHLNRPKKGKSKVKSQISSPENIEGSL